VYPEFILFLNRALCHSESEAILIAHMLKLHLQSWSKLNF